jgi:ABC-2 type transport system ATP-binding protein
MNNVIEIEGLKKCYKRKIGDANGLTSLFKKNKYEYIEAVKGINFNILEGEMVGFVGLNGAGKSTAIKIITGILHPDEGQVKLLGKDSYINRKKNAKKIGVMFGQRSNLIWDLPFINSLQLLKKIYDITDKDFISSIELANEYLDIKNLFNIPVRTMSLGQRMKCEFAAITLHNPDVFILDEPTIGLDILVKRQINNFLTYLNNKKKSTILLTTHDIGEIEKICKRVIVLNEGLVLVDDYINKIVNLVEDTFAVISISDEKCKSIIEKANGIKIINDKENEIKIKLSCTLSEARKRVMEFINIDGVNGVSVEQPSLEDILFYLLERGKN